MALSKDAPPQVTLQGRRALSYSKGLSRVPLEELGPALFNRLAPGATEGAPTSGRHCMNLIKRILTIEGFATYSTAMWRVIATNRIQMIH